MARKPKKAAEKPAAKPAEKNEDYDDMPDDDLDSDGDEIDIDEPIPPAIKTRDWRDVERLKEERRLKSLIDDDLDS
jgi:hypothetical protein